MDILFSSSFFNGQSFFNGHSFFNRQENILFSIDKRITRWYTSLECALYGQVIVGSVGKSAGFPMGGPVFEPSGQRDAPGFNNPRGVEVMEFALNPSYSPACGENFLPELTMGEGLPALRSSNPGCSCKKRVGVTVNLFAKF